MVAGGRGHGAEASFSRAGPPASGEERVDEPPSHFVDAQEEQQLWEELRDHSASLNRALNEALLGLGIRYLPNRSVRFFGTRVNSVLQKSVPIGSYKNSVPRVFGIGKFGSVPVLTERYRVDHKEDVIACSKTNFDMVS
jgi:hypothetical protein